MNFSLPTLLIAIMGTVCLQNGLHGVLSSQSKAIVGWVGWQPVLNSWVFLIFGIYLNIYVFLVVRAAYRAKASASAIEETK